MNGRKQEIEGGKKSRRRLMTILGRNCKTGFHERFGALPSRSLAVLCRIVMAAGDTREAWLVMRLSGIGSPWTIVEKRSAHE
jgi:hypothetical protein